MVGAGWGGAYGHATARTRLGAGARSVLPEPVGPSGTAQPLLGPRLHATHLEPRRIPSTRLADPPGPARPPPLCSQLAAACTRKLCNLHSDVAPRRGIPRRDPAAAAPDGNPSEGPGPGTDSEAAPPGPAQGPAGRTPVDKVGEIDRGGKGPGYTPGGPRGRSLAKATGGLLHGARPIPLPTATASGPAPWHPTPRPPRSSPGQPPPSPRGSGGGGWGRSFKEVNAPTEPRPNVKLESHGERVPPALALVGCNPSLTVRGLRAGLDD